MRWRDAQSGRAATLSGEPWLVQLDYNSPSLLVQLVELSFVVSGVCRRAVMDQRGRL